VEVEEAVLIKLLEVVVVAVAVAQEEETLTEPQVRTILVVAEAAAEILLVQLAEVE